MNRMPMRGQSGVESITGLAILLGWVAVLVAWVILEVLP